MGWRFYRRVHVLPGIRLNFGMRGASVSFGMRHAWYTVGPHGRRRATLGFGHGLYYTSSSSSPRRPLPATPPAPSFLRGLFSLALLVAIAWSVISAIRA